MQASTLTIHIFNVYEILHMQHETDPDATQYDKSAREELGI